MAVRVAVRPAILRALRADTSVSRAQDATDISVWRTLSAGTLAQAAQEENRGEQHDQR